MDELSRTTFNHHKYKEVPQKDEWRISSAIELLSIINGEAILDTFSGEEIFNYVLISYDVCMFFFVTLFIDTLYFCVLYVFC